jgi:PPM family protein phosphatase
MDLKHTFKSNTGLKRLENEDSLGVYEVEEGLLAIVCDGLGGNNAGEIASKLTVDTIYEKFRSLDNLDYMERIKQAIIDANSAVIKKSEEDLELKGMATTAEVLFLKDDNAYWGHVGDSRIYIVKNGKLKQLTKDHSLVQKLVDEGYLTLKEAENHPNKNIIMRALGDSENIDVDVSKQKLNSKDEMVFFMCTDGVSNLVQDHELEKIIKSKDLEIIPDKIADIVEERGAPDNYSFVIIVKSS